MFNLKNRIRQWILSDQECERTIKLSSSVVESSDLQTEAPFRLSIHKASGGLVVETRTYDRLKDRTHQNLHIVTHEQNLSEQLAKIVTVESLRN